VTPGGCLVQTPTMALIVLEAHEEFAHRHDEKSFSRLVAGSARLEQDGSAIDLMPGVLTQTDAGMLHRLVAGPAGATIECRHTLEPEPPVADA